MTEEARKAAAEYMREWRKKNPEKQEEYRRAYWQRKAEEARQREAEFTKAGGNK